MNDEVMKYVSIVVVCCLGSGYDKCRAEVGKSWVGFTIFMNYGRSYEIIG